MRRILVALDGTELAASILPDACRLAGPDGELILFHGTSGAVYHGETAMYGAPGFYSRAQAMKTARAYLDARAQALRARGVAVQTYCHETAHAAHAIDEAARVFRADMVACATHGRGPLGRILHGGVAWRALAHSAVPVLLRHPEAGGHEGSSSGPRERRIMVPLDGSDLSETALPLAQQLAREWGASLHLIRVATYPATTPLAFQTADILQDAKEYLHTIARSLGGPVYTDALLGPIVPALVQAAGDWSITDVVMASHGRTGLPRTIFGSVADGLIQHMHLPIVVIPALAAKAMSGVGSRGEAVGAR